MVPDCVTRISLSHMNTRTLEYVSMQLMLVSVSTFVFNWLGLSSDGYSLLSNYYQQEDICYDFSLSNLQCLSNLILSLALRLSNLHISYDF